MDVGMIVGAFVVIFIVLGIGGGLGYFFWKKSRPKILTWNAKVWQIGEGVRQPEVDVNGNIISELKLQDLKAYATDILKKIEIDTGVVRYELQTLHKQTPPVEADFVDNWGNGVKEVNVLLHKGGCTFMKKGYDKIVGEIIFSPLPQDTINLIKGEMIARQKRLKKEKDILEAVSPWIIAGICVLGLIGLSFIMVNGFIKISQLQDKMLDKQIAHDNVMMDHDKALMEWRYGLIPVAQNILGVQPVGYNGSVITITE